ncbi:MAG TPA: glycosyltransferase family 2 protein [Actinomycetota bacterium]|nr:glycosyltransferase family 2 protein [Actinomycetota bacterium]
MGLPTISVVTPCLNARATIEQTLDSVASQDYPKIDHVIIDGGSTDGCVEVLEGRPGIRFISEPDRGLSDAVNKGFAMARGDVVGWLNADDPYLPGALEAVAATYQRNPSADWITGRCMIIDGDNRERRKAVTAYKNFMLDRYSYPLLLTNNFISAPASFVTRSAFERIGGCVESLRYAMDYDMWLKLGRLSPPVVVRQYLAAFRMIEGTLSMDNFPKQFREHAQLGADHGQGRPVVVATNRLVSRGIVGVYHAMRLARKARAGD